jgi:hypothetical protein
LPDNHETSSASADVSEDKQNQSIIEEKQIYDVEVDENAVSGFKGLPEELEK